jgi:hypothetical protein
VQRRQAASCRGTDATSRTGRVDDSAFLLAMLVTECRKAFGECEVGWIIFVAGGGYLTHVTRLCRNWTTVLIGVSRCYAVLRPVQSAAASGATILWVERTFLGAALVLLSPHMFIIDDWLTSDTENADLTGRYRLSFTNYTNDTEFDAYAKRLGMTFRNECFLLIW